MNSKKIFTFILLAISAILLSACKQEKIEFYRESSVHAYGNVSTSGSSEKDVIKKSSGVIIYKDNTSKNVIKMPPMTFGPRDINFDMPYNRIK